MADKNTVETVAKTVGVASVALGAAGLLSPDLLARSFGIAGGDPAFRFVGRLWATHTTMLGALLLATPSAGRRTLSRLAVVMNVADGLVAFTSGGLSSRSRVQVGLTSAAFAAASATLAANSS